MNALFRVELLTNHSSVFMCVRKVLVGESRKRQAIQIRKYNKTKQKNRRKTKKKKNKNNALKPETIKFNAETHTYILTI